MIKCYICGKEFIKPVENLFKLTVDGHVKHCCGYTCWQRAKERKAKAARKAKAMQTAIKLQHLVGFSTNQEDNIN